jgi:hypothetical protein
MIRRTFVVLALGTTLVLGAIAVPALAGTAAKSNAGRVHHAKAWHAAKPSSVAAFKAIKSPTAKYVAKTCAIDLSAIPDFTVVSSVTGCGVTVTFSTPMEKRSVPGSWATWGSPPDTEGDTPNVLYTGGATDVTLTYSNKNRRVGVEAEPNPFEVHPFTATFRNNGGLTLGVVSRDIDGSAGARLLAGDGGRPKKHNKTATLEISSDVDFAIGQIRVS